MFNCSNKEKEEEMEKSDVSCDSTCVHKDVVDAVKSTFMAEEVLFDLSDFYKIFGDTTRIKILYAIDKQDLCVCDIASILNMTVSAVSHPLKQLRDSNLVKTRREGKSIYYSLSDDHVRQIIDCGLEHIMEKKS